MELKVNQRILVLFAFFTLLALVPALYDLSQGKDSVWMMIGEFAGPFICIALACLHYIWLRHDVRALPKRYVHVMLRDQQLFRLLAHHLMKVAGVPARIPIGAMNALELDGRTDHIRSGSPLDGWPVRWVELKGLNYLGWYWRRIDKPIVAMQSPDGTWFGQVMTEEEKPVNPSNAGDVSPETEAR